MEALNLTVPDLKEIDVTGPLPCHYRGPMPASAGIGAKPQHFEDLACAEGPVKWIEVHAENYMSRDVKPGGPHHSWLERLREKYPLSVHGVGLSLGSPEPLDPDHLDGLKRLVDIYQPALVSEHLAWSRWQGKFFNDLLPIPYTDASLENFCDHVDQTQEVLGRQILIENPSAYLSPKDTEMSELDFLSEVTGRTGCGLLFDVNNVYVSAKNAGTDAAAYIDAVPGALIGEVHLAGFTRDVTDTIEILIDTHGALVHDDVWQLYNRLIGRVGALPTLIEWDTDVPEFGVLESEAGLAERVLGFNRMLGSPHV